MKRTLLLLGLMCSFLYGNAQQHISVSTTEQLFAAIAQARQTAGRDTLYIHLAAGTYDLDRPIVLTEQDARPIVFEGDSKNKPVISAGRRIGGWSLTPEGWWKCRVPEAANFGWRFEQLFINGRRATRARTPDKGFYTVNDASEDIHFKDASRRPPYATQTIRVNPSELDELRNMTQPEVEQVVAHFYHKWDNTSKFIQYAVPDSGCFFTTGRGMQTWNAIRNGSKYFLENYRAALNTSGEWFLDAEGTLLYIPREGEDIATAECYASVLPQALIIKGTPETPVCDKTFRHITFAYTASYMPRNGHEAQQVAAGLDAAIMADCARRIVIDDCEVQHTGNYAIWLREKCHDNKILHTFIHDIGAGGIQIGDYHLPDEGDDVTDGTLVENCILRHLGLTFPCAGGVIIFHSAHNRILHNEICDLRYTGVSVGWVWGYARNPAHDNEVGWNHIHHIGWGELSDMGAVYTLGIQPGTRVHDNVIHDVWSYDYGGWGLYTDEGSTGIVMENNLVYNTKCGGFHQHYGKDNIIRNNIFAWGWLQQIQYSRVEEHRSFCFEHNIILMERGATLQGAWEKGITDTDWNCYFDASGNPLKIMGHDFAEWKKQKEPHSINEDPRFRNPKNGDFHFVNSKVAKKIGFKPFDYTKAGAYGTEDWKAKALMEPTELEDFSKLFK
ncbi:MAG: right-handed parallel beta-helix repeat-containing protein [Bacteroidaceae bacterium]|nr:right-handed parallel beta-helix repeat-containing protein [Bacteroidaceae bacterium]